MVTELPLDGAASFPLRLSSIWRHRWTWFERKCPHLCFSLLGPSCCCRCSRYFGIWVFSRHFCTWARVRRLRNDRWRRRWPLSGGSSLSLSLSAIYVYITTDVQLCCLIFLLSFYFILFLPFFFFFACVLVFWFLFVFFFFFSLFYYLIFFLNWIGSGLTCTWPPFLWEIYSRVIHFVGRCVALFIRVAFYDDDRNF